MKRQSLFVRINESLDKYRVQHYGEFVMSWLGFDMVVIYGLYVISRYPVVLTEIRTMSTRGISTDGLLVGLFYAFTPLFEFASLALLMGGFVWAVNKVMYHSLRKISEYETMTLVERIADLEKDNDLAPKGEQ